MKQIMNADIRKMARVYDISFRAIAHYLNVHPNTICNWMAVPLTSDRKEKILSAIDSLKD